MHTGYRAGLEMGRAIIEMVRLIYDNQIVAAFYEGLFVALGGEFEKRNITSKSS